MKVSGSVAIVTGGASGIGKAICQKLLENGAKVCILDIQQEAGTATVQDFTTSFPSSHVMFEYCDVSKRESLAAAFDKVKATLGGLDIVCNNAGVVSERSCEMAIKVNLMGTIYGLELAIHHMGRQHGGQGGVIVNTASICGIYPVRDVPVYCATKAAICMYTKCMAARDLQKQGIRISAICPTAVETPFVQKAIQEATSAGWQQLEETVENYALIAPADVAEAVYHLITDDTQNGTILQVFPSGWEEFPFPEMPLSKTSKMPESTSD